MSKRRRKSPAGTLLELWRPPQGAGDAIGCLTTTYTFDPGLFDELCLARFLDIESEPNREDLAFLLERESRLGAAYAGVLVDHTQAGVDHSLRWDVLPVRIPGGKQHAKLSVLAWTNRIRVIVASANLTVPGYRNNFEVAVPIDAAPERGSNESTAAACAFLRSLLGFVVGAENDMPGIKRATSFLRSVERRLARWASGRRREERVRQRLVFTLPSRGDRKAQSSLDGAIDACRQRGESPREAWIASPFFDTDEEFSQATAALCKSMARGEEHRLWFGVPAKGDPSESPLRLAAPRALLNTPGRYSATASFKVLPQRDEDKNPRPWHAKMVAFRSASYTALLIGSSNFTCAGLGITGRRNAEANVLTLVDRGSYAREPRELESIWPEMKSVEAPEEAEWLGPAQELDEEERAAQQVLPTGFLSASYRAGEQRAIVLRFDVLHLPEHWTIMSQGQDAVTLVDDAGWVSEKRPAVLTLAWQPARPPAKLLVQWPGGKAFWTLNVEDARQLPAPAALEKMSADDMLGILAASDPSAALRAWAKNQQPREIFDDDLDTATPADLDPLRRYDLQSTLLHRVRRRARVLARLRENLQRPVWSRQALEWRLRGLIGVEPLAIRFAQELEVADGKVDEAMLTLADFVIVLREVTYQAAEGSLGKAEFNRDYLPFLRGLVAKLEDRIAPHRTRLSKDLTTFWNRVVQRCHE